MTPAPPPGCLAASPSSSLLYRTLLWAASASTPRFLLSYVPFYGIPGALLLFVAVRYGQVRHDKQQSTLTTALSVSICRMGTAVLSPGLLSGSIHGVAGLREAIWGVHPLE